jgi:hypothetical protein
MHPRVLSAIALISFLSLFANLRRSGEVADFYARRPLIDGVSEFQSRMTELRAYLPPKGVIGYTPDFGMPPDDANAQAEFHLIQYALAPVIVVYSPNERYVIGNFHQKTATADLEKAGLKLVKEFGNGIALFQNTRVAPQ